VGLHPCTPRGPYSAPTPETEADGAGPPPQPPGLAACSAHPNPVAVLHPITVLASYRGDGPVILDVEFGDGSSARGTPGVPPQHTYAETGTFEISITARSEAGADDCTVTISVHSDH